MGALNTCEDEGIEQLTSWRAGDLAAEVGKGVVAGAIGTLAMTVSSTVEMKTRRRKPSTAPADAAAKVLKVAPTGEAAKERFSNIVHLVYGTLWGSARGLIEAAGLHGGAATGLHFTAVWGAAIVMLPTLEVAPPVWKWGRREVAIDAFHHVVYALGTGTAYGLLNRWSSRR